MGTFRPGLVKRARHPLHGVRDRSCVASARHSAARVHDASVAVGPVGDACAGPEVLMQLRVQVLLAWVVD